MLEIDLTPAGVAPGGVVSAPAANEEARVPLLDAQDVLNCVDVRIDGAVGFADLAQALRTIGLMLVNDGTGGFVARYTPAFIRAEPVTP